MYGGRGNGKSLLCANFLAEYFILTELFPEIKYESREVLYTTAFVAGVVTESECKRAMAFYGAWWNKKIII
jgi:hypothetical protein